MNCFSPCTPLPVLFLLLVVANLFADQQPIVIDGQLEDWASAPIAYDDPIGDGFGIVDFGKLWLADDDDFLFIRIELTGEVDSTENNTLRLYLDTDANQNTGLAISGIGAELEWALGTRSGLFYVSGSVVPIMASDIQFRGGPTVTSTVFEFAVGRNSFPDGSNPLFTGPQVRLLMSDLVSGDQIPNQGQTISYIFDVGNLPDETVIPLARDAASDLRMMTHNVLFDSPWDRQLQPRFERLWSASAPDVINLQEIYNHSLSETLQLVNNLVQPPNGQTWHGAANQDCFTISLFPILQSWSMSGNLAVLLDTTSAFGIETLVVNAHLPCCANEAPRQSEIDQIMAFIREAQLPGGSAFIDSDTPIVICGDLNLVGFANQLDSLLTGEIADNGQFGPDFTPDWDGTAFTNVVSRQTEKRMGYTWRNDNSSFWPGQLDYFIYSDSVLELRNNFLLYTPEMSDPQSLGLSANDSLASDHLVFVADFRQVAEILHGDVNLDGTVNLLDVGPFIDLLSSGGYQPEADINKDGQVNLLDVQGFIDLLNG